MADRTRQSVLFEDLTRKPVHVTFDAESLSSEGGTTLLASVDRRIGLTERLVSTLTDRRQRGEVTFGLAEMFRQRVYSIGHAVRQARSGRGNRTGVVARRGRS